MVRFRINYYTTTNKFHLFSTVANKHGGCDCIGEFNTKKQAENKLASFLKIDFLKRYCTADVVVINGTAYPELNVELTHHGKEFVHEFTYFGLVVHRCKKLSEMQKFLKKFVAENCDVINKRVRVHNMETWKVSEETAIREVA